MLAALAVLAGAAVAPAADSTAPVDLALVLAVDCSDSVDRREFRLQIDGLAFAFRDPAVLAAIRSGPRGKIAVSMFEWSDFYQRALVVDWTIIDSQSSAEAVARRIEQAPRVAAGGTSVSSAIDGGVEVLAKTPWRAARHVIDVSGDGTNNAGGRPDSARDRALARGIVVNGLAITDNFPDLKTYYLSNVTGGPGHFVIEIGSYDTFAEAMLRKLLREISKPAV